MCCIVNRRKICGATTMPYPRQFNIQMLMSHIATSLMTTSVLAAIIVGIIYYGVSPEDYRVRAMIDYTIWQFDDTRLNDTLSFNPDGFTLIVDETGRVLHTIGITSCDIGEQVASCAQNLARTNPGVESHLVNGEHWVQSSLTTRTGDRVISHRGSYQPALNFGLTTIYGLFPILTIQSIAAAIVAAPISLLFSLLIVQPQVRRIAHVAAVSRQFADGDFDARVKDHRSDEVGQLGQQFDDMAATIQKNLTALRELAQQNAVLARQVESIATQNERLRLSRDLHDTVSQRLFSLSMIAATLPELISQDTSRSIERAKMVADIADAILGDLRNILVDLRPTEIIEVGFIEAMKQHLLQWEREQQIQVATSIIIQEGAIPAIVQDAIYRVMQEAMSNIARHANATSVAVTLVEGNRQLALSITDDGCGFDTTAQSHQGHYGLSNMRERVTAIGGTLTIDSDTSGTSIQLLIPLQEVRSP
jgi:signal transduction histidine kinase